MFTGTLILAPESLPTITKVVYNVELIPNKVFNVVADKLIVVPIPKPM